MSAARADTRLEASGREQSLPETAGPHELELPLPGPRPEDLVMHLERDQLVAETFRPVARAQLSRGVRAGLWALRIFTVLLAAMVLYTFVSQLS
jgi:hypothetical protein